MAEDPKKPTRGEMLKMAVSDVNIKNQKIIENPFNEQSTIISAKQLDVDRFATYDSKTYGKLGFDPFKDSLFKIIFLNNLKFLTKLTPV